MILIEMKAGTVWSLTTMGKAQEREQSALEFRPSAADWRLQGACVGMDPDLFDAGPHEHWEAMLEAREACLWCPVFKECSQSFEGEDDKYSLKAGRIPDLQASNGRGRPSKSPWKVPPEPVVVEPKKPRNMLQAGVCPQGLHAIKGPEDMSGGGCKECKSIRFKERYVSKGPRGSANTRKTHCPRGHEYSEENTYYSPSNPKGRKCRKCNNVTGALRKKRSRVAKMEA